MHSADTMHSKAARERAAGNFRRSTGETLTIVEFDIPPGSGLAAMLRAPSVVEARDEAIIRLTNLHTTVRLCSTAEPDAREAQHVLSHIEESISDILAIMVNPIRRAA